jgi:hypothetical protein
MFGLASLVMFRPREMTKTGVFFRVPEAAVSRAFKHRARSEPFKLPCVAFMGSGWLVAPYRAPFFIGATPASCDSFRWPTARSRAAIRLRTRNHRDPHGQVAARDEIVGLGGRIGAVHSEDGAVCDWHWLALVGTI